MPAALQSVFDAMQEKLDDELMSAWMRGVCDGFEYCARLVEGILLAVPADADVLTPVAAAMRQAQVAVLLDGLKLFETEGDANAG